MDLNHLFKTHLKQTDTEKLKTKRWKRMYLASTYQRNPFKVKLIEIKRETT